MKIFPAMSEASGKLARSALLLYDRPACGDKPAADEIGGWLAGSVTGKRAAEIKSHVARDADCFSVFLELSEKHAAQEAERTDKWVRTALLLQQPPDDGVKPDYREVAAYIEGRLDRQGAQRVKSWLARDSESFAVYRELLAMRQERAESQSVKPDFSAAIKRLFSGFGTGPFAWSGGASIALASVFGIAVALQVFGTPDLARRVDEAYARPPFVLSLQNNQWLWNPRFSSKDMLTGKQRQLRRAFRTGIRQGLSELVGTDTAWREVVQELPASAGACPRSCRLTEALGRWAVFMYAACRHPQELPPAFWQRQRRWSGDWLQQTAQQDGMNRYRDALRALQWPEPDADRQVCGGITKLLALGKP